MRSVPLDESDRWVLLNCLRTAIGQYQENAKMFETASTPEVQEAAANTEWPKPEACKQLARQFTQQGMEAQELYRRIEDAEQVCLVPA